jgi:3-phosphoshikimate 1-carboxyvinyltransferase
MTEPVRVPSAKIVEGTLRPPPSKSVSHRYLNLALLAGMPVEISHPLQSEDLEHFEGALGVLGYSVTRKADAVSLVPPLVSPTTGRVFCGNAGTLYRFLVASLATIPGTWVLDGTERLRERPVGPLVAALRDLGAEIRCPRAEGLAPLEIVGGSLRGGRGRIDAAESSQYVSALVMAAARALSPTEIVVEALSSSPYLELTLGAMTRFGVDVGRPSPNVFRVSPTALLPPADLVVEPDYSAAAYPAAAALLTDGRVRLQGLQRNSLQGDRRFLEVLVSVGAECRWEGSDLLVSGRPGRGGEFDLGDMPDQVPTLAALAPFLEGESRIVNVAHLRIKESDRLAAMAAELSRVGAQVEELEDGLVIQGTWHRSSPPDHEVLCQTYDDHRIAMAMALVGLRRPGVSIATPQVVDKSYPHFWSDLDTLLG